MWVLSIGAKMNIFVTDTNPYVAAANLDDKRVVKMILESTQMLCTAINENGGKAPYKSTHKNHPSNVWARQNRENWYWLWHHAMALSNQYTSVYGKEHKCVSILTELNRTTEHLKYLPEGTLTPFANCAANQSKGLSFKHIPSVTDAYKEYLAARWATDARKPTWTNRTVPSFYEAIV